MAYVKRILHSRDVKDAYLALGQCEGRPAQQTQTWWSVEQTSEFLSLDGRFNLR